jgi:hypothetical protein
MQYETELREASNDFTQAESHSIENREFRIEVPQLQ